MLSRNQYHEFSEIIDYVKSVGEEDDDFCIYGEEREGLEVSGRYFISDYPDVNDDDKEIYPEPVISASLSYLYSGQQFVDVVTLVLEQKSDATYEDYVNALNYYDVNDEFMDF